MRTLIFSDLHANWDALLAMQQAEEKPDAVFFLGDVVGYGPEPAACIQWVRANATAAVQGNHDYGLANDVCSRTPAELHDLALATQAHSRQVLHRQDEDYLRHLPQQLAVSLGGATFYLVHGAPHEPVFGNVDLISAREAELRAMIAGIEADLILIGNTHIPATRQLDGRVLLNPGSLGQPRYGAPDPTYAIWEGGEIRIRHLHVSHDRTIRKIGLLPLDSGIIKRLQRILKTGHVVPPVGTTGEELRRGHGSSHGATG